MNMDIDLLLDTIVARLKTVPGLTGLTLGGSRARGTHHPTSDLDLGLYYEPDTPPDLTTLRQVATALDDTGRTDLITPLGGWGPWINGGGWLKVQGQPVDFLYRNLAQVRRVIAACQAGELEVAYQPGHPHGFVSSIYLGEVAYARLLWDPTGVLAELQTQTQPYPPALCRTTVGRFLWEARFSLDTAAKAARRGDVTYVAGCAFRTVACLNQTIFALNGRYLLNEKGATGAAAALPLALTAYQPRVAACFGLLQTDPAALTAALDQLAALVQETETLAAAANRAA